MLSSVQFIALICTYKETCFPRTTSFVLLVTRQNRHKLPIAGKKKSYSSGRCILFCLFRLLQLTSSTLTSSQTKTARALQQWRIRNSSVTVRSQKATNARLTYYKYRNKLKNEPDILCSLWACSVCPRHSYLSLATPVSLSRYDAITYHWEITIQELRKTRRLQLMQPAVA